MEHGLKCGGHLYKKCAELLNKNDLSWSLNVYIQNVFE